MTLEKETKDMQVRRRQHMALQGRVKIERWPRWIFGSPLVLLLHICVDVTAVGPATGL